MGSTVTTSDVTYLTTCSGFSAIMVDWAIRQAVARCSPTAAWAKTDGWCGRERPQTPANRFYWSRRWPSVFRSNRRPKFGADAAVSRNGSTPASITITNYERIDKFNPDDFAGVVCDEVQCDQSV